MMSEANNDLIIGHPAEVGGLKAALFVETVLRAGKGFVEIFDVRSIEGARYHVRWAQHICKRIGIVLDIDVSGLVPVMHFASGGIIKFKVPYLGDQP